MAEFCYTVLCNSKKRISTKGVFKIVDDALINDVLIDEVNKVLRINLENQAYVHELDHLMLFLPTFSNFKNKTNYNCIYIIAKAPIKHKLFIEDSKLKTLLNDTGSYSVKSGVYDYYPSFRFNNTHTGDFLQLDNDNNIFINIPKTTSQWMTI